MIVLPLDRETARRFILGKQGLWPGRRWKGLDGVHKAMRAMEYLQLDPLNVIARSQDIALCSRVIGYSPEMWEQATYEAREFFDWGNWLAVRPMDELPHWRAVMRRERDGNPYLKKLASQLGDAIVEMRSVLAERGTVANRDFAVADRRRTNHYRGRKDSSLALYYLWYTGEAMTHHRENFERVYAPSEAVAPSELLRESDDRDVDRFLVRKEVSYQGLTRLAASSDAFERGKPYSKRHVVEDMLADGELVEVQVEGWKNVHYALGSDVPLLEALSAGRVPEDWAPLEASTLDEAVFLAPLDPVSARGRSKVLFDFEYAWEVYKPKEKRTFGYYVLPVLWGDRLVARFDSRLDRESKTFVILGLWLEDAALGADEAFAEAFARGLERFIEFLGAEKLDARVIGEPLLRKRVEAARR